MSADPRDYRRALFHSVLVAFLATGVYANTLANGFVLDDDVLLLNNRAVHGLGYDNLRKVFTSVPNGIEYLPVRDLAYMLDYSLFGLDPFGFHLSNVLYYAIACIALYWFLSRLLSRWVADPRGVALLASLLFAAHPVHVEAVATVSNRKDVLMGIFFLLSAGMFERYRREGSTAAYALSILFCALSLLSKSAAFALPAVILLMDLFCFGRDGRSLAGKVAAVLPHVVATVLIAGYNAHVVSRPGVNVLSMAPAAGGTAGRIGAVFEAFFLYGKLTVLPYPLVPFHPLIGSPVGDPVGGLLPGLLAVGVCAAAVALTRRGRPCVAAGIVWFVVTLLPAFLFAFTLGMIYERYLFLPVAGWCVVAGGLLSEAMLRTDRGIRVVAWGSVLSVLAAYCAISVVQNGVWRDSVTLMRYAVERNPGESFLRISLVRDYLGQGKFAEAREVMSRAKQEGRLTAEGIFYLALALYKEGNPRGAIVELEGLADFPERDFADVQCLYGHLYRNLGMDEESRNSFRRALEAHRTFPQPFFDRGHAARELRSVSHSR